MKLFDTKYLRGWRLAAGAFGLIAATTLEGQIKDPITGEHPIRKAAYSAAVEPTLRVVNFALAATNNGTIPLPPSDAKLRTLQQEARDEELRERVTRNTVLEHLRGVQPTSLNADVIPLDDFKPAASTADQQKLDQIFAQAANNQRLGGRKPSHKSAERPLGVANNATVAAANLKR